MSGVLGRFSKDGDMKIKNLCIALLLTAAAFVSAQNVTLTSTRLNVAGQPYTGILFLQPTLSTGQPTWFRSGSGGTWNSDSIGVRVTAGSFTVTLPDTTTTYPANICYTVVPQVSGYSCLQPHTTATGSGDWCQAGVCNLDNYLPNLNSPPLPSVNFVQSVNSTAGPLIFTGTGVNQVGNVFTFPGGGGSVDLLTGATPVINAAHSGFVITLSAPTTPSVINVTAGTFVNSKVCQPVSGGPYVYTCPTAMHGCAAITSNANQCTTQLFYSSNGSTLDATNATGLVP